MVDQRITKLAKTLVNYSCSIKKGEKVLIETIGALNPLTTELIKEVYLAGGIPFINNKFPDQERALYMNCTKEQLELIAKYEALRMKEMDAFIGLRAPVNFTEESDIPGEKLAMVSKYVTDPVHMKIRVPNTKWVVLRYPTPAMAQAASTSTEAFEDFYFDVCNLDYSKMSKAMDPLVTLLEKTDKVRITGPNTDLNFSIKGMNAIKCDGQMNIPDGEVYTAPLKTSVNGYITYNTPAVHDGFTYENIRLEFKDGKIIKATSNDTEKINIVFDTDEGARYIGEFALGVNPFILKPMKEALFDEKICGSIHFTPGNSYDDCDNTNKSSVHWDLVFIQRPECGGGDIYFDDILIRRDGLFVLDELKDLN